MSNIEMHKISAERWTKTAISAPSSNNGSEATLLAVEPSPLGPARRKQIFTWWWWEILSAILSVLSMVAVIAILCYFQDRPRESWTFSISPNSIISVFITVAKSALILTVAECLSQGKWGHFQNPNRLSELELMDTASRGPWGSLQLLLGMKTRNWVSSCAAFVIILALAADPFAQQILLYPTRQVSLRNETALIAKAQSWGLPLRNSSGASRERQAMEGSIFNAVYNLNPEFPVICPSGQCQWPDFFSLGVCATCSNVTEKYTSTCTHTEGKHPIIACNMSSPGGPIITVTYDPGVSVTRLNASVEENFKDRKHIARATLVKTAWHGAQNATQKNKYLWSPYPSVEECTLSWCAHYYKGVAVDSGVLRSSEVHEVALYGGFSPGAYFRFWAYMSKFSIDNVTFTVDIQGHHAAQQLLSRLLTTSYVDIGSGRGQSFPTSLAEVIYMSNSTLQIFQSIARGMTDRIRQSNGTSEVGTVQSQEVYIQVRWAWLGVPLLLVLLMIGILTVSILQTSRSKIELWRSSSLALMFHGLEGWDIDEIRADSPGGIRERAKNMVVSLRADDKGDVRFIKAQN